LALLSVLRFALLVLRPDPLARPDVERARACPEPLLFVVRADPLDFALVVARAPLDGPDFACLLRLPALLPADFVVAISQTFFRGPSSDFAVPAHRPSNPDSAYVQGRLQRPWGRP
jgi:hypothetical protein